MGNKDDIDREDVPPILPSESSRKEFAEHGEKKPRHTRLTGSAYKAVDDEGEAL